MFDVSLNIYPLLDYVRCGSLKIKGETEMVDIVFQAHCNICNKAVSVAPVLNRDDLVAALERGADVRVTHVAAQGDHTWSLSAQDKQNLSNTIAKGFILGSSGSGLLTSSGGRKERHSG